MSGPLNNYSKSGHGLQGGLELGSERKVRRGNVDGQWIKVIASEDEHVHYEQ